MKNLFTRLFVPMLVVFCLFSALLANDDAKSVTDKKTLAASTNNKIDKIKANNLIGKLPRLFEQNIGQKDEKVKFFSHGNNYSLFLTANEANYQIPNSNCNSPKTKERKNQPTKPCQSTSLSMRLLGANQNPTIYGIDDAVTKTSYFIGNDSAKWQTDVSNYYSVNYQQIYDGIDFIYRSNEQHLQYDFRVAPNIDPSIIQLEFSGANKTSISKNGELILAFKGGELRHKQPFAFQIIDGEKKQVEAKFIQLGKNKFGFELGEYDKTKELIIDPIEYLSYIGGSGSSLVADVVLDSSGNIYLLAENLRNFMTIDNSASVVTPSVTGSGDIFVTKLDPTATQVLFNAWIGGSSYDTPQEIDIDGNGNIVVGGLTESRNFPMILARQTDFGGAANESHSQGFIFKMSPAGNSFLWSTYHGATDYSGRWDMGWVTGVDADTFGNVYVSGHTTGNTFPIVNGFQTTRTGNSYTGYVSKYDANGQLVYSTYFGATNPYMASTNDFTDAYDVKADVQGNAYISGENGNATILPLTANPYKGTATNPTTGQLRAGGSGFVAKFNTNAVGQNSLIYSTYTESTGLSIAVDSQGNAFTLGRGNPGLPGAGVKLNSTGTGAIFTVPTTGHGIDCEFDAQNSIYFAEQIRERNSNNLLQYKVLVRGYNASGSQFGSQTIDGNSEDFFNGIAVAPNGGLWVVGYTFSTDLPISSGAIQPTKRANTQGFLAKVILDAPTRNPLIFVPGTMGSELYRKNVDGSPGDKYWLRFANGIEFHPYLTLNPDSPFYLGENAFEARDIVRNVRYDPSTLDAALLLPLANAGLAVNQFIPGVYQPLIAKLTDKNEGGGKYEEFNIKNNPTLRKPDGTCDNSIVSVPNKPNFFVFPYDFRKDNALSAAKLKDFVQCIRQFYPDNKVDILGHSQGGLVARRYILDSVNARRDHYVDKLITIGSPFLGAPEAFYKLETGGDLIPNGFDYKLKGAGTELATSIAAIQPSLIKSLLRFFPSGHQLLPTREYQNLMLRQFPVATDPRGKSILSEIGDVNKNGIENEEYTFDQFASFVNKNRTISPPADNAAGFHDCQTIPSACGQDSWTNDTSGVKYFHILGTRYIWNTTAQVSVQNFETCTTPHPDDGSVICGVSEIYNPMKREGDGTVPRHSAERGYVNSANYGLNAPNAKVVNFRSISADKTPDTTPDDTDVEHTGLTEYKRVHDCLLYWLGANNLQGECPAEGQISQNLKRNKLDPTRFIASKDKNIANLINLEPGSQQSQGAEAYYVKIIGISDLAISDEFGNKFIKGNDIAVNPVKGFEEYKVIGNNASFLTFHPNSAHFVDFQAGNSPLMIDAVKGVGNENPNFAVRFKDLSLPQGVKARLTLAPQGVVGLAYDSNGDGSFDTPVNPTAVLSGTQASDVTGPVLAINYIQQGSLVNVSINGQDNLSGINNIKFSTDGVNFKTYQSPFTLTYQGTPIKVYAFADDNAANRSGLFTKEINLQDFVAPTTLANQNPDPNQAGWNNTDVNINLTSTDNTSGVGVKEVIFSANGAQPIPSSVVAGNLSNIQIQNEGVTNVSFGARDNVGNTETFKSWTVRIDKTAPVTQGTYTINGQSATITLTPNDLLSGVSGLVYSVDGGVMQNYQGAFNINGVGDHRVTFFATDTAGNLEVEKTLTYTINPGPLTLSIIPMLQCVQENQNGTLTGIFGYQNNNPSPGSIPIGNFNKVTPATLVQTQPTFFQVGGVYNAFTVTFNNGTVTWHLTGPDGVERNAKASSKSTPCQ